MKTLPSALASHITGEATSLCRCWIIETTNGQKIGFTDHDNDLVIDGVTCERNAGAEASGVEERIGLNVDQAEIAGALQSDRIRDEDIEAGLYDGGKITTYLVNWNQPQSFAIDQVMLIGEIRQEDGHFKMEMRSLSSLLEQTAGRHFISTCQADLGDEKCGVNLNSQAFKGTGEVTKVLSPHSIRITGLVGFKENWFAFGHLHWRSGNNANFSIEVTSNERTGSGTVLGLWQPMPHEIQPGDRFDVTAGCDKRFSTCKAKFSNYLNFRGFPHIPGDNFALSTAGNSDQFDGSAIIP